MTASLAGKMLLSTDSLCSEDLSSYLTNLDGQLQEISVNKLLRYHGGSMSCIYCKMIVAFDVPDGILNIIITQRQTQSLITTQPNELGSWYFYFFITRDEMLGKIAISWLDEKCSFERCHLPTRTILSVGTSCSSCTLPRSGTNVWLKEILR